MKKLCLCSVVVIAALALISTSVLAGGKVEKKDDKSWWVTIDKVPTTFEECQALRDELAKTPQGGMVYYLVAKLVMTNQPEVGEKCVVIGMDKSELTETINLQAKYRRTNVKGWQLAKSETDKMKTSSYQADKPYVAKSYVNGTDSKNAYKLPELPYKYYVRDHRIQKKGGKWDNTWHGFVNTSGNGGGAVPYFVKKNAKGVWKMYKSSSYYSGCIDPPKAVSDDL